jgi:hypothetical protein
MPVRSSACTAAALLRRDQQVLEHGHVAERPRHLVGAADAQPAPRGGIQPGHRAPGEADLARAGGEVAGDEAEQAGLAGAVRPHDPDHVPGRHAERQVLRDDDAAEPLRHVG